MLHVPSSESWRRAGDEAREVLDETDHVVKWKPLEGFQ